MKIEISKRQHKLYTEYLILKKKYKNFLKLAGRWQYIYKIGETEISLVSLSADISKPFKESNYWEIYQLKGPKLFSDVVRFSTKESADKYIRKILRYSILWRIKNFIISKLKKGGKND